MSATETLLAEDDRAQVRALAERARAADAVAPLSESFLLALDDPGIHILRRDPGAGDLLGYAGVLAGQAEIVVDPGARGRGLGSGLLTEAERAGARTFWAHGDLPPARILAQARGLRRVRALHKMSRPLTPGDAEADISLDGYTLRPFTPGDAEAWLGVNARAFAWHPEQGRVTREDLDRLMEQDWFDPEGLLLLTDDADGSLAGSHWTKVDPSERAPGPDGVVVPAGEVYVVALDPAQHGKGLSRPLTLAGLRHLAAAGLRAVVLYVEGDNAPALATYRRLGFSDLEIHAAYAPAGGPQG